jgi:hypothetical protein
MHTLGQILNGVGGLIALVCHIIVIVKMFQTGQTGLGIVAIVLTCCGIGILLTLIYGWVKVKEWNVQPLMIAFTVGFILSIIGGALAPPDYEALRKQMGQ